MKTNNHITADQIELLLRGEPDDRQLQSVTDHLDSCEECQLALDAMAAEPKLWAKASKLISEPSISDSTMNLAKANLNSPADIEGNRDVHDHDHEFESVVNLLDAPSHPEMMGRLGNYDIEHEVGRGGMGIVLKAFDTELNRPLAIKVLAPWLARNGTARQRFEREARAAAAVLHPNVVSIYGVNARNKHPYLVMPYVAGPSLQTLIEEHGPLDEKDVVRIALQVSAGLAAAHAQGLVHRDVKPANILVEADVSRVLVTDFGLARAVDDASATQSGYFVGTPNYMSPEQSLGKRVDARSDLFSLGSVIYFIATGRMPFRADSPICVLNRISNDEPTGVRQINSDVSETLSNIIEKLLDKNPENRFQSAGELHDVLEKYLAYLHQPDVSKPPFIKNKHSKGKPAGRSLVKPLGIASLLFGLFVSLSAGFGSGWFSLPGFGEAKWDAVTQRGAALSSEAEQRNADAKWKRMEVPLVDSGKESSDSKSSTKDTWGDDSADSTERVSLDLGSGKTRTEVPDSKTAPIKAKKGRPGEIVTVTKDFTGKVVDGYTIYLPRSYVDNSKQYPVLMCLQGGSSVGGDFSRINKGLYILLNKSHDPRTDLPKFLKDSMIVLSPHIKRGEYYDHGTAIKEVVDEVILNYRADRSRVYLSGISRGGSGVWGLASTMPDVFAAAAPLAGNAKSVKDYALLASTPMWIAHDKGDSIFSFGDVEKVVSKLDTMSDKPFHRIDAAKATSPGDLERSKVFVVSDANSHDAWSAVYNNFDFYKWLLKHRRTVSDWDAR